MLQIQKYFMIIQSTVYCTVHIDRNSQWHRTVSLRQHGFLIRRVRGE